MKSKKSIIRATAFVLISVLVALAANILASAQPLALTFEVKTPSVSAGQTFDVEVRVSNPSSVASNKIAGLQVALEFDTAKLSATADSIAIASDVTNQSMYAANINGNKAILACIKSEFTDNEGYTQLEKLYTVTFTAKEDIADTSKLFTKDNLTFIIGNTEAQAIESAEAEFAGNIPNIAAALDASSAIKLSGNVQFEGENIGSFAKLSTPAIGTSPKTLGELKAEFGNSSYIKIKNANGEEIVDLNAKIGTGCVIEYSNNGTVENAIIIVKGDIDGSGTTTAYDAALALRMSVGLDNYKAYQRYAADVTDNSIGNAAAILRYSAKLITSFDK